MTTRLGLVLYVGRELPQWKLWCLDETGTVVSLASATVTAAIRQNGSDTSITATITQNANPSGDGTGASDTPTLVVAPASGQLDNLVPGRATVIIVSTTAGLDEEWQFPAMVNT